MLRAGQVKKCTCGVTIQMRETIKGNWVPCRPNITTFLNEQGEVEQGWKSHWDECPDANKHRKRGK